MLKGFLLSGVIVSLVVIFSSTGFFSASVKSPKLQESPGDPENLAALENEMTYPYTGAIALAQKQAAIANKQAEYNEIMMKIAEGEIDPEDVPGLEAMERDLYDSYSRLQELNIGAAKQAKAAYQSTELAYLKASVAYLMAASGAYLDDPGTGAYRNVDTLPKLLAITAANGTFSLGEYLWAGVPENLMQTYNISLDGTVTAVR